MNYFLIGVDGNRCVCTKTEAIQYMSQKQIDYLSSFAMSDSSHLSFTVPDDRNKTYQALEITKKNIAVDCIYSSIRVVETSDAFERNLGAQSSTSTK